jgi:hypothetical protein
VKVDRLVLLAVFAFALPSTADASVFVLAGPGSGFGPPAEQERGVLNTPQDVALMPGGGFVIADAVGERVVSISARGSVSVLAGTGRKGYRGDGGPGPAARLNDPTSVAVAPDGRVAIGDAGNLRVRVVTTDGTITTVAGTSRGFAGDGGPATQALLDLASSVEYDAAGNLYISEQGARRIRKVDAVTGIITTYAGTGVPGFSGDGGPASQAQFNCARGSDAVPSLKLTIDGQQLYVADTLNNRIRVIDLGSGIINTFAGTGEDGYAGDGGPALAAKLSQPTDVSVGPDHSVYVADAHNNVIRRIYPDGTITTVAGNGTPGFSGDGGPPTQAQLSDPSGVFVDRTGMLYIADTLNHRIRACRMTQ